MTLLPTNRLAIALLILTALPAASAPVSAQSGPDHPTSFLDQLLGSLGNHKALDDSSDAETHHIELDAVDLALPSVDWALTDSWDPPAEIPAAPTENAAVFDKQPEDDVFEVPMRETFAFASFDYAEGTPTIACMPARVCSVELEAGEVVLGRAMGDPDRWLYQELSVGDGTESRVLLALMPKVFGARTNLILTTDRRVYTLALASADIEEGEGTASAPLTERARFHYSDAWAKSRSRPEPVLPEVVSQVEEAAESEALDATPDRLNFHYTISDPRSRKRRFAWRPTVYDDGRFTYVLLPQGLTSLPAIRGRDANHDPFLLNETYHHDGHRTYIEIPRLTGSLELVLGTGRDRKTMTIHRNVRLP